VKWSPRGAAIEVAVSHGEVTVRDHGPGIDPEDLPNVFDRFYRASAARGRPGSGLGLAIVRNVAETHGGTASAENKNDGGALFRLTLRPIDSR
jgi:two-component system sensor histidine kinase MprB